MCCEKRKAWKRQCQALLGSGADHPAMTGMTNTSRGIDSHQPLARPPPERIRTPCAAMTRFLSACSSTTALFELPISAGKSHDMAPFGPRASSHPFPAILPSEPKGLFNRSHRAWPTVELFSAIGSLHRVKFQLVEEFRRLATNLAKFRVDE